MLILNIIIVTTLIIVALSKKQNIFNLALGFSILIFFL